MELTKMNRIMKYILAYLPVIILTIYIAGCSELEPNIEHPGSVTVHKEGIMNRNSPDFHGKLIRENNWDMMQCQQCHASDYSGGITGASCLTCHTRPTGPENCATCHGSPSSNAPPRDLDRNTEITNRGVGAHQIHLSAVRGRFLSCTDCHKVPGSVYDEGHVDDSDSRAEVIISSFIANLVTNDPATADPLVYDATLPVFTPDPSYNFTTQTCASTYCHGNFKNGNVDNAPVWNDPATARCGSCHGDINRPTIRERALPKTVTQGGTHPEGLQCHNCHGGVINADLNFINPSKHIDGKLNLFGADVTF
jgi:predicted CxxxxCH...CXXCH cytochrome family protein